MSRNRPAAAIGAASRRRPAQMNLTSRATGKPMRAGFGHVWRVSEDRIARFGM